jgi:hypothetical protein
LKAHGDCAQAAPFNYKYLNLLNSDTCLIVMRNRQSAYNLLEEELIMKTTKTGKGMNCFKKNSSVFLMIFILLCLANCEKQTETKSATTEKKESQLTKIEYKVCREWKIPNGGFGKVIVIDSSKKNENDLRKLGDTLKYDTRNDRNSFIFVFDNAKAAAMQQNAMNLNKTDGAYYDIHFIANYTKNANTGYHQFDIMVDGVNGKTITVKY